MHVAILVGGTGPTESIAAVAGRVAYLWRATTRVRVPLPVPRGGCARRDKIKPSERARRVEVLGLVSLVRVLVRVLVVRVRSSVSLKFTLALGAI